MRTACGDGRNGASATPGEEEDGGEVAATGERDIAALERAGSAMTSEGWGDGGRRQGRWRCSGVSAHVDTRQVRKNRL